MSIQRIGKEIRADVKHVDATVTAAFAAATAATVMELDAAAAAAAGDSGSSGTVVSHSGALASVASGSSTGTLTGVSTATQSHGGSTGPVAGVDFHWQKMATRDPTAPAPAQELPRIKEQFGKLKNSYLQADTRQAMLETMAQCAPGGAGADGGAATLQGCLRAIAVDKAAVDAIALDVSNSKKRIGATKKEIKNTKAELIGCAKTIEIKYGEFERKQVLYNDFVQNQTEAKLAAARDSRTARNSSTAHAFGGAGVTAPVLALATPADCEFVHERQRNVLNSWQSAAAEQETRRADLTAQQLEPLQRDVSALQTALAEAEAEQSRAAHNPYVATQRKWYGAANAIMSGVNGGVTAAWRQHTLVYVLTAAPKAANGQAYALELTYPHDHSADFLSAKLVPAPDASAGAYVADVLQYGVASKDRAFLIRELTERLRNAALRQQHVATIGQKAEPMKADGSMHVSAALSYGSSGANNVRSAWLLPCDYPASAPVCTALSWTAAAASGSGDSKSAAAGDAAQFDRIKAEVNASAPASIAEAIDAVQRKLAAASTHAAVAAAGAGPRPFADSKSQSPAKATA